MADIVEYIDPSESELPNDIAIHNMKEADKRLDLQNFIFAANGWISENKKSSYQELERLLRKLNCNTHLYAKKVVVPKNMKLQSMFETNTKTSIGSSAETGVKSCTETSVETGVKPRTKTSTETGVKSHNDLVSGHTTYSIGTASQNGTTITGSDTTFTNAMVGGVLIFSNGTSAFITGYTSATSLTSNQSQTVSNQSYVLYYNGYRLDNIGTNIESRTETDTKTSIGTKIESRTETDTKTCTRTNVEIKYECIYSCRPEKYALIEIKQDWKSYEENFDMLRYAGTLVTKDKDLKSYTDVNPSQKSILFDESELTVYNLILTNKKKLFYKRIPHDQHLHNTITNFKKIHDKEPETRIVGMLITGNPVITLMHNGMKLLPYTFSSTSEGMLFIQNGKTYLYPNT